MFKIHAASIVVNNEFIQRREISKEIFNKSDLSALNEDIRREYSKKKNIPLNDVLVNLEYTDYGKKEKQTTGKGR